jgi:hypothetical protein
VLFVVNTFGGHLEGETFWLDEPRVLMRVCSPVGERRVKKRKEGVK